MNFCILIELSKEHISFLYSRSDSDNGFVPFVEQSPLPLAIYCSGNQLEIGQFAVDEANKHNPNAYVDVFGKMRNGGTFRYRGEEIPNNMLLYNAIQRYLASFFDSTLIGQMGRLERNVATMPICFLFHADIDENERLFVKDSFRKSGFANVGTRDLDKLAMHTSKTANAYSICITSNGEDLFVNIYNQKGHRLESKLIRDRGRDPRMKVAVDKLWDSIGYDNYYLNKEKERPILEQVAERFLDSGKLSLNENVVFSDGSAYNVALYLSELEQFSVKDDGKAINEVLRSLAEKGIKTSDCTIFLQGKAAHNNYFSDMFKKEFGKVISVDNAMHADILATLLKEVEALDYKIADEGEVITVVPPPPPPPTDPKEQSEKKPVIPVVEPTLRDKRDFKILQITIGTRIANGAIEQAKKDIQDFTQRMHDKGVIAFDTELKALSDQLPTQKPQKQPAKTSSPSEPQEVSVQVPTKRDERDMKMLRMEVATYLHNGETRKIKPAVQAFRQKMHDKGIHAFDNELQSLEKGEKPQQDPSQTKPKAPTSGNAPTSTQKKAAKPTARPTIDEGTMLMRSEMFKEARDWFRANGQRAKADDCTTIIHWLRFQSVYESELSVTIETRNRDKARARAKEIKGIISLYDKYGVDSSSLTKLADAYKRIK